TTTPTALAPLPLHDALPIYQPLDRRGRAGSRPGGAASLQGAPAGAEEARSLQGDHPQAARGLSRALGGAAPGGDPGRRLYGRLRSEEHTSELQSRENLVCRL